MEGKADVLERLLALRGPLAKSWKAESRVFSQVIVVCLSPESAEPHIAYSFPSSSDVSMLAKSAMCFCFPEERSFRMSKFQESTRDTFTFTLTQADGSKVNGYCRRFLIGGAPECYCILSTMSSMSLFSKMLDLMEQYRRAGNGPTAITRFLMAVGDAERPQPGGCIIVRVPAFDQSQRASVTHKLSRETGNQNVLDYVSMQDLFQRLEVKLVTQLVEALLLERRLILCSSELGVVSNCVNALVALLNPFKWQHIFVPVLPRHLLDYCCAPMPFLIGIVDAFLPQVQQMPLEEDVVIVQLDSGTLLRPVAASLPCFVPAVRMQKLVAAVEKVLKGKLESYTRTTDLQLLVCFTGFYRQLLGRYREFFSSADPAKFELDAFVTSHGKDMQPFLRALEEAQLWNTFLEERGSMNCRGVLDSCPLLAQVDKELKCKRCGIPLQGNVYIRRGKGVCFKCFSKGNALGKLLTKKKVAAGTLRASRGNVPAGVHRSVDEEQRTAPAVAQLRAKTVRRSWSMTEQPRPKEAPLEEVSPMLRGDSTAVRRALARKQLGRAVARDDMCIDLGAGGDSGVRLRSTSATRREPGEKGAKHGSKDDMCLPSKSSISDLSRASQHKLICSDEIISAYVALRPSARKITNAPMPHRAVVTGEQAGGPGPGPRPSAGGWVASSPTTAQRSSAEKEKEAARRSFLSARSKAFLSEMAERKSGRALAASAPVSTSAPAIVRRNAAAAAAAPSPLADRSRAPTVCAETAQLRPPSRQVAYMRKRAEKKGSLNEADAEDLLQELVQRVAANQALDRSPATSPAASPPGSPDASPAVSPSASPAASPTASPKARRPAPASSRASAVRRPRAAPQRPVCGACGTRLNRRPTDVSLYANGAFWHPTCFRCQLCSCSIVPPYNVDLLNGLPVHVGCKATMRKSLTKPMPAEALAQATAVAVPAAAAAPKGCI